MKPILTYFKAVVSLLFIGALLLSQVACSTVTETVKDAAGSVADGAKNSIDSISSNATELYSKISAPKDADQFEAILDNITTQNIAAFVSELKANVDFETMLIKLDIVKQNLSAQTDAEDVKLARINDEIEASREFIKAQEHILGNPDTKHGEIAERLDVAARNIKRITEGLEPDATFENIGKTAPEDYMVGNLVMQSKFYDNLYGTFYAIMNHVDTYPSFGEDRNLCFVIAKDQYPFLERIMTSKNLEQEVIEYNGRRLQSGTVESIKDSIEKLEQQRGQSFRDIIKPSEFTYDEVQTGSAVQSLDIFSSSHIGEINAAKAAFKQEAEAAKTVAISESIKPSFKKLGQASLIGAGIDTFISVGFSIYEKVSDGKSIENFTDEDWGEIGIDALTGTAQGAGIGATTDILCIFGIPAPIAGAVIATIIQTTSLYIQYSNCEITQDELLSLSLKACITSSFIASGAMIGQMVIPIPIIGAIIGSISTGTLVVVVEAYAPINAIGEKAQVFTDGFVARYNELSANISDTVGSAVDISKITLAAAYSSTENFITEAVSFAAAKVNI